MGRTSPESSPAGARGERARPHADAWIRIGVGVGAASYSAGAAYGLLFLTSVPWVRATESSAAIVLLAAFALSFRRPRLAASIAIPTVWAELVVSVGLVGTVAPAMYAFPLLVIGTGLLFGGSAAGWIAAVSSLAVPAAARLGGQWGRLGSGASEGHRVLIAAATMLGSAFLVRLALSAHRAALAESERARLRYQGLFAGTPDAVVVTDADGRVEEANPAAERLLGRATAAPLAARLGDLLTEDPRPRPAAAAGPEAPRPARLALPGGGHRALEVSSREIPASSAEGGHLLHVLRDVTDARALEERLRHAQRLESVGLLAGGVAHDFNNLLTAVGGNAALLAEHPDPAVRELAAEIGDAQRRGVTLTRQLLAFARRDVRQPGPVDLAAAVREMGRLLARLAGEQHRVAIDAPGAVPVVADRGHVEQVVLNLVANARDAMPAGGDIRVRVLAAPASDARAAGSTVAAERQALLEVSDAGVGMAPEIVARIFEPFYTTKPRGHGTGLGLSTVHGIVGQSGGCVAVDTAPGRGSTLRVFLPLAEEGVAAERAATGGAAAPGAPRGRERILVVEDDPAVLSLVRRVLEGAGYQVAAAASASEALPAAGAGTRLVLTDVALPGMSGLDLARKLSAERPGVRVLFMSGYVDPALSGAGALDASHGLLRKPFSSEELLERVRAALDA